MNGEKRRRPESMLGTRDTLGSMLPDRAPKTGLVGTDAHPIRTQILAETKTLHKGQVLAPLVTTLTSLVISITRGFDSFWVGVFWTFVSIAAGIIAYYLVAVIRAPFVVIGRHHYELKELSDRLLDVEARPLQSAVSTIPALLPPPGPAQSQQMDLGLIAGVVQESTTGVPLDSVVIVTRDGSNKERSWTTASAKNGCFEVNVPPGSFTVTARLEGYRKESSLVVVEEGKSKWVEFNLKREPGGQ